METERLYYEDVYKKEFSAMVTECRKGKKATRFFWIEVHFIQKAEGSQAMWAF